MAGEVEIVHEIEATGIIAVLAIGDGGVPEGFDEVFEKIDAMKDETKQAA